MSAATTTPLGDRDQRPSFRGLVGVELRKMADTKAGMWLLIAIAAATVIANVIFLLAADQSDKTFTGLLQISGTPQGVLLPVLAILLVTQEWGQRTALATFTLTPDRVRVMSAKIAATLTLILGAFVIALLIALLLASIGGNPNSFDEVSLGWLVRAFLATIIGALWGFAFGAALLSSAFAIVAFFAAPTVVSIVGEAWKSGADTVAWFDLNRAIGHLYDPLSMSGTAWGQTATSALLWVALPLAIGIWRVRRTELK